MTNPERCIFLHEFKYESFIVETKLRLLTVESSLLLNHKTNGITSPEIRQHITYHSQTLKMFSYQLIFFKIELLIHILIFCIASYLQVYQKLICYLIFLPYRALKYISRVVELSHVFLYNSSLQQTNRNIPALKIIKRDVT